MKYLLLVAFGLILLAGGPAFAQGISGTEHDLSGAGGSSDEICIFCHTPHGGADQTPLWNRTDPGGAYDPYDSPTMDADDVSDLAAASGVSKRCLSCHDGNIAIGDVVGGNILNSYISGSADLYADSLKNDHPISFTYSAALVTADGELVDSSTVAAAGYLYEGKVECASCHDVHDNAGISNFLVESNSGSAICLTCHDK